MIEGCLLRPKASRPDCAPSRRYACPIPRCSQRFSRSSTLKDHLNAHMGNRPFQCPVPSCSQRFGTSSNLARHKSTRHPWLVEEMPCRVPGCDFACTSQSMLNRHVRSHTSKTFRQCAVGACDKVFSTPGNLRRHLQITHAVNLGGILKQPAFVSWSVPRSHQDAGADLRDSFVNSNLPTGKCDPCLPPKLDLFLDEDFLEAVSLLLECDTLTADELQ